MLVPREIALLKTNYITEKQPLADALLFSKNTSRG